MTVFILSTPVHALVVQTTKESPIKAPKVFWLVVSSVVHRGSIPP